MSDETPRLKLAQLVSLQELNAVTWNEALAQLDALVDLYLLGQFVNTPSSSPQDGDAYLVGGSPTGAWTGQPYKIATCLDGAWRFHIPFNGLRAYVASNKAFLVYQNGVWSDVAAVATGLVDLSAAGAGQIKFPAAQNPSGDANTLDDYEEGTFTPVLTTSGTPPAGWTASTAIGEYVKIGTLAFVVARLVLTSKGTGATGNARIGGLPFTVRATTGQAPAASPRFGNVNLSAGYSFVVGGFNGSTATAGFLQIGSGMGVAGFAWDSCLNDNSELAITGGYLT